MGSFVVAVAALAALWGCTAAAAIESAPIAGFELNASAPASGALSAGSVRVIPRREGPGAPLPQECDGVLCVPKCCPPGHTYDRSQAKLRRRKCVPTDSLFDPLVADSSEDGRNLTDWSPEDYVLLIGNPCDTSYIVYYNESDFWFNGSLTIYIDASSTNGEIQNLSNYCIEYTEEDDRLAHVCFEPKIQVNVGFTSWLYTFGLLTSVSCLIFTLIIYLMLETLRDLHGKSLVCHVGSLAIAYIMLASVQLSGSAGYGTPTCRNIAFGIQFFLLSSFLWLHVMCVDSLWAVLEATGHSPVPYPRARKWTISQITGKWVTGLEEVNEEEEEERRRREKMLERRVFLGYFIYVTIFSLLPVMMVLRAGLSPTIPYTYLDHNLELHNCGLESNTSLAYFYPIPAFITIANIIVFIIILFYAVPFNWNPAGPQRVPKQKARMCFLLFAIMSSNWIVDIISWVLGGMQLTWVMLHAFYILQGLITFLIFVLEDRVKDRIIHELIPRIRKVHQKYGCCHRPTHEEETTALRAVKTLDSELQPMGWVVPK